MPNPSLPDDLLAEILSYLPFETTTKFKCVSKSWRQLISHPGFISLHQHRWADRAVGFFHCLMQTRRKMICFQPLPALSLSNRYVSSVNSPVLKFRNSILSSSNGLFLIGPYRNFSVWDPSTTKAPVNVPPPPGLEHRGTSMLYGLAASPGSTESFHIVGICSAYLPSDITLYSSKTRSWARQMITAQYVYANLDLNPVGPVFVRGSFYWLKKLVTNSSILAFCLASRQPRVIKLPREDMDFRQAARSYYNVWLGEFAGYLYLVYVSKEEDEIELWRLERDDDKAEYWKKVMEAKGGARRAPLFFDGRRIAFTPVEEEWEKDKSRMDLFNTCSREWQSLTHCNYYSFDSKRRFLPYYL